MPRIHPAAPDQYVPLFGEDAPLRLQIYAQRPPLARKYLELGQARREERLLPDRLIELVRLRIAFWNQCRSCMATRYEEAVADGVSEALVCSLERPEEAEDLTPAERAAIAYGDLMATNHQAIDDSTFEGLREHFSEAEIVEPASTSAGSSATAGWPPPPSRGTTSRAVPARGRRAGHARGEGEVVLVGARGRGSEGARLGTVDRVTAAQVVVTRRIPSPRSSPAGARRGRGSRRTTGR